MSGNQYTVDYHLICAVYFSERTPRGAEIANLWSALKTLGHRTAHASFMCRGDKGHTTLKNSALGSEALSNSLIAREGDIVSVAASTVRPHARNAILDSDVNFTFQHDGVWSGETAPGRLDLSISGQVIEEVGEANILNIVKNVFETADRHSPIYGLVDLARPDDAGAGMVYTTAFPRNAPLFRWVEHMSWLLSAARKGDRVRGLYWGNYLGSQILNRLGGHERFLSICAQNACNQDGTPNSHVWNLPNGVFVSLCLDPSDCQPAAPIGLHPAAEANLRWLIRELGQHGVLNQW